MEENIYTSVGKALKRGKQKFSLRKVHISTCSFMYIYLYKLKKKKVKNFGWDKEFIVSFK